MICISYACSVDIHINSPPQMNGSLTQFVFHVLLLPFKHRPEYHMYFMVDEHNA